jgi:acyl-coenzyme A thioesterase PaaI-like protein
MISEKHEKKIPLHIDGEPGWISADPLAALGSIRTFVSGDPTGDRIRVKYFERERDGALVGKVWFGPGAEGPPGHAHGGSIAAVLDEAMGAAAWMIGHSVVIARLAVIFRRALPLGTDATVEARITRKRGRKIWICGHLLAADGIAFAESRGLFITLHMGRFTEGGKRKTQTRHSG